MHDSKQPPQLQMNVSETLSRLRQPSFLVSGIRNSIQRVVDAVAPTDYGRAYRQVRPYTMVSNARLHALHQAIEHVCSAGVPGDVVECGTARGGSAALMGLALRCDTVPRRLWVFDTFLGMPKPSKNDPDYEVAKAYEGSCRGDLADVTDLFRRLGLLDRTEFVQGMFEETLPRTPVAEIAVLHIDGDWYDSVMACLLHLYDKVSPGGIVQIDDFGYWEGTRKAVEDFFRDRSPKIQLRVIDYAGRQFVKP